MINLYNSDITDILPEVLSEKTNVKALGYAVGRAMQRLLAYCRNSSVYAVIDNASDEVLDMLAQELDTQYYEDSLDINVKRQLVKNTLVWYASAGTPAAVEELVSTVFGEGKVQEWFEYGGEPYYFKVSSNADLKYEAIEEFEKIIRKVKNTRSHLEKAEFVRSQILDMYIGIATESRVKVNIGWED